MDMNNVNIEEIVKQVLAGMSGNAYCSFQSSTCTFNRQHSENSKGCYVDSTWSITILRSSRFLLLETMTSL